MTILEFAYNICKSAKYMPSWQMIETDHFQIYLGKIQNALLG